MKYKSILFVIIIVILLVIIGFMGLNMINNSTNSTQETVLVGSSNFTLPEGYHEGESNSYGDVNITNGEISIFLLEYHDSDLNKHIGDYNNSINDENQTLSLTNFTYNNIMVYKAINNAHPNTVHYWYVCNNKTYSIYSWDYGNLDDIVTELIQSQKFS
ncbi:hypothetical protein [Methanobrevibacter sp.]|uniref:hypothetical protein n=1 Tax=Methanobrevibacter sp. TaxID=66852 RepID=UPI0025CC600B|nr:hypothetical protein [Methanobrevibacter sp.]MBQ2832677.1 hypothetical protein [Methanobrevibacter sp.]